MRNVIIENEPEQNGFPPLLTKILKTRFTEQREVWWQFTTRLKANKEKGIEQFLTLAPDSNIIGETNFHEIDTLETMVLVLDKLMEYDIKINLYGIIAKQVFRGGFNEAIDCYLNSNKAIIIPSEFQKTPVLQRRWKMIMNAKLRKTFDYHNVYEIKSANPKHDKRITVQMILS